MRLFHRHKWRVERQGTVTIERRLGLSGEFVAEELIGRIDRCECGRRQGWFIGPQYYERAAVAWLEAYLENLTDE